VSFGSPLLPLLQAAQTNKELSRSPIWREDKCCTARGEDQEGMTRAMGSPSSSEWIVLAKAGPTTWPDDFHGSPETHPENQEKLANHP